MNSSRSILADDRFHTLLIYYNGFPLHNAPPTINWKLHYELPHLRLSTFTLPFTALLTKVNCILSTSASDPPTLVVTHRNARLTNPHPYALRISEWPQKIFLWFSWFILFMCGTDVSDNTFTCLTHFDIYTRS